MNHRAILLSLPLLAVSLLVGGCRDKDSVLASMGGPGDGATNGDDDGDGNDGGGDGDGNGDDGDGSDGDGIKYDVDDGDGDGGPGDEEEECGKVDFLFVVDPSGSMDNDRQNLIDNFPGFISGILSTLTKVDDYHVGVIATRGYEGNISGPGCDQDGALVVEMLFYAGLPAKECGPYAEGHNYMTTADDLVTTFSCAADLHTELWGDYERPMSSLLRAADGTIAGPGQCNEGFLRDDSLLVVVIITDEPDGPGDPEMENDCAPGGNPGPPLEQCGSLGTPTEWFDELVAARGGIEENIVVLSLIHYWDGPCPPAMDTTKENIKNFTDMFTHGIVGGICEPDYGPYFEQAISVIDVACDEYRPPEG